MRTVRTLVLFLALAAPASAEPPRPWVTATLPETQSSAHFVVHYTTAAGDPNQVSDPATIGPMLDLGERAYTFYTQQLGFSPLDDGDGKIDVYVFTPANAGTETGATHADTKQPSTTSAIWLRPASLTDGRTIGHELVHVMQQSIYRYESHWVKESTAEWGLYSVLGTGGRLTYYSHPEIPLDCEATTNAGGCEGDGYGYRHWPFWETVREEYGLGVVKDVFVRSAAAGADKQPHSFTSIDGALAPYGSDLVDTYFDTVELMVGGAFTLPGLANRAPNPTATVPTGAVTAELPAQTLTVDHLAARYVKFVSGGAPTDQCKAATLALSVDLPAGIATRPVWARGVMRGEPLAISGSTATASIPWRTCDGAVARLAVPNGARDTTGDGATFTVHASLTVATPPPPKVTPAPVLLGAAAPAKVRLKRTGRTRYVLRVQSDSAGALAILTSSVKRDFTQASWYTSVPAKQLGPGGLRALRAGANRYVITLPRHYRHKRDYLVLTPSSADQTGKTTVLLVRYLKPKKKKAKRH